MFKKYNKKILNRAMSLILVFCLLISSVPNIFAQGTDLDEYLAIEFETNISKIWDDKGHEDKRPSSVELVIYGSSEETDDQSLWTELQTITLTSDDAVNDYCWNFSQTIYLASFNYYHIIEKTNSEYYEVTSNSVEIDLGGTSEQSLDDEIQSRKIGSYNEFIGSVTNSYVDNSNIVQFTIEKIWDDEGYENIRPSSINVDIYGTNTKDSILNGEKIGELTISGEASSDKWVATTDIITTGYSYFYITEKTMNNYSTTIIQPTLMEPVPVSTTNVEPSNNNVSPLLEENNNALIKAEEIENADTSETFSFLVSKMWVEPINLLNERAESITFNLYQNNKKIDSLTMTAEDADDDMTWINGFANKYPKYDENGNPYEYRIEEEKSETTTGVPYLATFDKNINSIATLGDENNTTQIVLLANQRLESVAVFEVIKEWKDEGFENERPQNLTIAIYLDSNKDGTPDKYLSEADLNSSNVDPNNSNKWVSFALIPRDELDINLDDYAPSDFYLVENTTTSDINLLAELDNKYLVDVTEIKRLDIDTLPDDLHPLVGSLMPDWRVEYNGIIYQVVRGFTSTIVNNHIDKYSAKITNKYVDKTRDVQFKINKTWEDYNNQYNTRPESIQVEIYGVNTEGITEGGELLQTVTLNKNNALPDNSNKWEIITDLFKTDYDYFYIKEINSNNEYVAQISPITKVEEFATTTTANIIDDSYPVMPLGAGETTYYIQKIWNDNNNEKGKRPESVLLNIYEDAETLFVSMNLSEDSVEILENPRGIYWSSLGNWKVEGGAATDEITSFYINEVTENYTPSLDVTVAPNPDFPGNDVTLNITNTYTEKKIDYFEVDITNLINPPQKDVQFKINKIWDDQNNRFGTRPDSIEIEIYGTETQGANYGGELLQTITLDKTHVSETDNNKWELTTPLIATNYQYFYIKEICPDSYSYSVSEIVKNNTTSPTNEERISPFALRHDDFFLVFHKEWEDNNDINKLRPEFVDFNIYYNETNDEATKQYYGKVRLYEDRTEVLENPLNCLVGGIENNYEWEGAVFTEYNHNPYYFWVEELPVNNYDSDVTYDTQGTIGGAGVYELHTYAYNTYNGPIINTYNFEIKNTLDLNYYDISINKVWDDDGFETIRPEEITIKIFGTNNESDANNRINGILLDTVILTVEDEINSNAWMKSITIENPNIYDYVYIIEELPENSIDYIVKTEASKTSNSSKSRLIEWRGSGNQYYANLTITNITPNKKINIVKNWDDFNQVDSRPDSINISIMQNGDFYKAITLTDLNNWKANNIEVPKYDTNGDEYVYSIIEDIPNGYTASYSEKEAYDGPVRLKFSEYDISYTGLNGFKIVYEKEGKYYVMEIETKSTRPSYNSTYFKLDENNCIEIPSPNFYVYYNWGFSTGGEYTVKFAVESIEKISSTTNEGVYLDNINGSGLDNAPEITNITDIKLDFDNLDDSLDIESDSVMWKYTNFSENAFVVTNSKIAESTINITKIWIDENNKYYTRPSSLDITVYQNENVYKVLTLTNANADISDPNTWKVSLSVPIYDDNGNKYVYTIKESEENLSLEYYYYEPYYEQELLTVTNKGNWLPPVKAEDDPIYTITITKEIVNKNNEIASAEDFLKLKLNIDDTYNFPIVLKQLNRSVSKGETSMIESYNGYSGNIYNGIVTNKGDLIFSKIPAGKYEISESFVQYFEFIGMEEIGIADIIDYDGASLTYENGKYYIVISGLTHNDEQITVKVINKLDEKRFYNNKEERINLFLVKKDEEQGGNEIENH